MPPPRLSETLEIVVKSLYGAALAGEPSVLADCGRRLLDRISPPNWTLEWSLPGWLGNAHGLDTSTIADLTLANVFGLAYIKLQDDLLDGEVGGDDRQAALLLSSVLHRKWLLVYTGFFPGDSPFWRYFEQYMTQWVRATWASRQEHVQALGRLGRGRFAHPRPSRRAAEDLRCRGLPVGATGRADSAT